MRLPDDEHTGWDRLIEAVLEPDDADGAADADAPMPADPPVPAGDVLATLDLVALQARSGSAVGDRGPHSTI